MNIIRIGIDLAKNTFSICGVDNHDKIVLEKTIKRKDLLSFFSNVKPCIIAMESGSGAHHGAYPQDHRPLVRDSLSRRRQKPKKRS